MKQGIMKPGVYFAINKESPSYWYMFDIYQGGWAMVDSWDGYTEKSEIDFNWNEHMFLRFELLDE